MEQLRETLAQLQAERGEIFGRLFGVCMITPSSDRTRDCAAELFQQLLDIDVDIEEALGALRAEWARSNPR